MTSRSSAGMWVTPCRSSRFSANFTASSLHFSQTHSVLCLTASLSILVTPGCLVICRDGSVVEIRHRLKLRWNFISPLLHVCHDCARLFDHGCNCGHVRIGDNARRVKRVVLAAESTALDQRLNVLLFLPRRFQVFI